MRESDRSRMSQSFAEVMSVQQSSLARPRSFARGQGTLGITLHLKQGNSRSVSASGLSLYRPSRCYWKNPCSRLLLCAAINVCSHTVSYLPSTGVYERMSASISNSQTSWSLTKNVQFVYGCLYLLFESYPIGKGPLSSWGTPSADRT